MVRYGLACVALVLALTPPAARAACYEIIGCTHADRFAESDLRRLATCPILWEMRNGIYSENGYCFRTERAISAFGNVGCAHDDTGSVPLNDYERANIATIVSVERAGNCPR